MLLCKTSQFANPWSLSSSENARNSERYYVTRFLEMGGGQNLPISFGSELDPRHGGEMVQYMSRFCATKPDIRVQRIRLFLAQRGERCHCQLDREKPFTCSENTTLTQYSGPINQLLPLLDCYVYCVFKPKGYNIVNTPRRG